MLGTLVTGTETIDVWVRLADLSGESLAQPIRLREFRIGEKQVFGFPITYAGTARQVQFISAQTGKLLYRKDCWLDVAPGNVVNISWAVTGPW